MNLKLLWYCTKNKPYLQVNRCVLPTEYDRYILDKEQRYSAFGEPLEKLNGKIVAESGYELMSVHGCIDENNEPYYKTSYSWGGFDEKWLTKESRLNHDELVKYLGEYKGLVGKAIYIWFLNKFEQPKELKDLYIKGTYNNAEQMFTDEIQINGEWFHPMKKAPQNMCYAYDKNGNKYVLISVRPEWLCLILNGLKDVELRKKVLKEML